MSMGAAKAGKDLYYEEMGTGVPIVLIHPAGATASTWGSVVDELAKVGRVIAYDRRGYGRTGGDPARSIAAHTADAAALLDRLQTPPALIVGLSAGATTAIDLARLRPDLVRAVVAHEAPWRLNRHAPTRAQLAALAKIGWLGSRRRYPEAATVMLRTAYAYGDGGSAWDRFPDEWQRVARENARATLDDFRLAFGNHPTAKELASVRTPVVCTCGERSGRDRVNVTLSLARAIPSASFRRIKGAGHAAQFDAPLNFVKVIGEAIGT